MDPYLENPEFWPEAHSRFIVAIAIALAPALRPKYRVAIEKRIYTSVPEDSVLVGIPDVSVTSASSTPRRPSSILTLPAQAEAVTVTIPMPEEVSEGYLEIREVATGYVVTVIELLSPKNKRAGMGREKYEKKRMKVLSSPAHLVEIDLLRGGEPMRMSGEIPETDYRILICRSNRRPLAQLYAFSVRQEIPSFLLPLQSGDTEPVVDLQSLFAQVYEQAGFDMAIDYTHEPVPALQEEDRVWAEALLPEKGLRG
jgi:hypothetical protein